LQEIDNRPESRRATLSAVSPIPRATGNSSSQVVRSQLLFNLGQISVVIFAIIVASSLHRNVRDCQVLWVCQSLWDVSQNETSF